MTQRANIDPTLKTSLLNNEAFIYYNLVKFEKPQPSLESGGVAKKAIDYAYITDAPFNVSFDDGSADTEGNLNGSQTYIANRLISVGGIQESDEARASTTSIALSTLSVGLTASVSLTVTTTYVTATVDLAELGFREGDKILINGGLNDNKYIRIDRFTRATTSDPFNSRAYVTPINTTLSAQTATYTLTQASEEIIALTRAKGTTSYASYINREVFIYRVHASPATGDIIGAPFLIFKGIIGSGSIQEDPDGTGAITWGLTSHWGDFVRVQGRITSDQHHRALDLSGKSDANALIRAEYANDYGFMHAEQAINVAASFMAEEIRYTTKRKSGWSGWFGATKLIETKVQVERDVDLRFDLTAKYLPVVYGVQKVGSIPVFADVSASNPAEFYVVYALCEGEIAGIYDIHVDQQPMVCSDQPDYDTRGPAAASAEENNVDVICYGRADKGDVLQGENYRESTGPGVTNWQDVNDLNIRWAYRDGLVYGRAPYNVRQSSQVASTYGITHEKTFTFTTPIDAQFIIHTGKPDQEADDMLVAKAMERVNGNIGGFKIQTTYFDGSPEDYWSTSHRLLDTANVVAKFTLNEGETTVPEYEFVVKGKFVQCYNYDGSFRIISGSPTNWKIGDTCNLVVDGNGGSYNGVKIIDKWTLYGADGVADVRFRWRTNYPGTGDTLLDLGTTGKTVTMTRVGGGDTVIMGTYDKFTVSNANVGTAPTTTLSLVSYAGTGNTRTILVTFGDGNFDTILAAAGNGRAYFSIDKSPGSSFLIESYDAVNNRATIAAYPGAYELLTNLNAGTGEIVYISNVVVASGGTGAAGDIVEVTKTVSGAKKTVEKLVKYVSGSYIFTEGPWPTNFIPALNDKYSVGPRTDMRVTNNPVMQLLDYITSKKYGRGLALTDLHLPSWLEAARLADDRSKVAVVTTAQATIGAVYNIVRSGDGSLIFEGTVVSSDRYDYNGTIYWQTVFDDVIGKLGYKWSEWRSYKIGDIIWGFDEVSFANANGTLTETAFKALNNITTLTLTKLSGGGPATLTVNVQPLGGIPKTNTVVRAWNENDNTYSLPGYSLYDSDNVKYWKYLGWDEQEQRYVTRHQLNQAIETSTPIFDNINNMLRQFNGVLRFSNGLYALDVKTSAPSIPSGFTPGIDSISEDDIIGAISIQDKGQKDSYNSINTNIIDPQNKFATREVSFFNSTYLKEDRGVPKQGTYALPGISNYYNARLDIMQHLNESRYGLTIGFKMDQKGYLLLPGEIIIINYRRFNWVNKAFRITDLTLEPDGLISIIADEHNNSAYLIEYIDRDHSYYPGTGGNVQTIAPPTSLTASSNLDGAIELRWTNSVDYDPNTHNVEVYAAQATKTSAGEYVLDSNSDPVGNEFSRATLLDVAYGSNYVHNGLGAATNTNENGQHIWYYWIRYVVRPLNPRESLKYSVYHPLDTAEGVEGRATSAMADNARSVTLTSPQLTWIYNDNGDVTVETPVIFTATAFNYVYTPNFKFYVYDVGGNLITSTAITPTATYSYTPPLDLTNVRDTREMPETLKVELYEDTGGGQELQAIDFVSVQGIQKSSNAIFISLSNPTHQMYVSPPPASTVNYTNSGTTIEVLEGTVALTPVTVADLDPGQFKVGFAVRQDIDATILPSVTADVPNKLMIIGIHNDMTEDYAYVTYNITVQRFSGLEEVFQLTQYFNKVRDGSLPTICSLVASDHSVVYDAAGANPTYTGSGGNITLTASAQGYTTPEFRIAKDGGAAGAWQTSPTFTHAVPLNFVQDTTAIILEAREAGVGGATSSDSLSIIYVKQGTGGLSGVLTNENHTVTSNDDGSGYSLTTAGGRFEVFQGGTDITTSCTFGVNGTAGAATSNGLRMTIVTSGSTAGNYSLTDDPYWGTYNQNFNLQATIPGTGEVLTKIYTISKARAGVGGKVANLTASDYTVIYNDQGTDPNPTTINLTLTHFGFINPRYKFQADIAGNITNTTYSVNNTAIFTVPATNAWNPSPPCLIQGFIQEATGGAEVVDSISIQPVSNGTSAFTIEVSNPVQGLVEVGGIMQWDLSGTTIKVYEGAEVLDFILGGSEGNLGTAVNSVSNKWTIGTRVYGGALSGWAGTKPAIAEGGSEGSEWAVVPQLNNNSTPTWTVGGQTAYCDYPLIIRRKNQTSGSQTITVRQSFSRNVVGKDGTNAYMVFLDNAAHNVYTDPPESLYTNADWTGSGTNITCWKGSTQLLYNSGGTVANTWRVTSASAVGGYVTVSTPTTSGDGYTRIYGNHTAPDAYNGPSNTAWVPGSGQNGDEINYTIVIKDDANNPITVIQKQSLVRVPSGNRGAGGIVDGIDLTNVIVPTDDTGENYSYNGSGYINDPSTGQSFVGHHTVTENGVDKTDLATHTITGGTIHSDTDYYRKIQNGMYCFVTRSATGITDLPIGSFFFYVIDGNSWTTDHETFELVASYGGQTFNRSVSITKSRAGAPGVVIPPSATGNVQIVNRTVYHSKVSTGTLAAGWRLNSTGAEEMLRGTVYSTLGSWLTGGSSANFKVKFSHESGDSSWTSPGTTRDVPSLLSTSRYIQLTTGTYDNEVVSVVRATISNASTNAELVTALITLRVYRALVDGGFN